METNLLREFVELAKRLNFTETAQAMDMSQPTLSKHIGTLEKDLKLSLFDRNAGNLRLSKSGTALLPSIYKILSAEDEFRSKVKELHHTPPPHLSVSGLVDEEVITEILGRIIASLRPRYGTGFLEARRCHHKTPLEMIKNNSVDMIFDYAVPEDFADDPSIRVSVLNALPFYAVVSVDHPFAKRESLHVEDLKHQTLVRTEGTHVSDAWRFIEQSCERHGFKPRTRSHYSMKMTDLLTIIAMLDNEVLLLASNFAQRIEKGTSSFSVQIPIVDDDLTLPLSVIYDSENRNPLIHEAIAVAIPASEDR